MAIAEVVISYRREDAGDAGRLSDWLGSHFGHERVFMDTSDIRGGDDFPAAIGEAIRGCKAVVTVVAANWSVDFADADDWVRRELREAIEAGRPIVPVLLHGAPPPQASDLPPELAKVAELHAITIADHDFRDDIGRLIEDLERLGAESGPATAFPELPKQGRAEARAAWDALDTPGRVQERLEAVLKMGGLKVAGSDGDSLLLVGGSGLAFRLIGGFFASERRMPIKGRLRLRDRGAATAIEVLLAEDVGASVFSGLGGRYESRFRDLIADLREATARR